ncbi:mitogen-activated protein kinase [Anaeramoeba flamelloides]|uniref:Mitogen-activated protein kinase n=1 Tax=Anaeramoeba flamelloides TaxID=1746091 RepID=A0AAV7Z6Z7_9EUKA|nr:mitogen-activated protein kinase [Anaeramoeba flamelloides]KAJ6247677.1 mitogen-activated protein kinase [Anaeramoeba flamelloides]
MSKREYSQDNSDSEEQESTSSNETESTSESDSSDSSSSSSEESTTSSSSEETSEENSSSSEDEETETKTKTNGQVVENKQSFSDGKSLPWMVGKNHTFPVAGTEFTIDQRYQYIKKIGHGAYGIVISAKDRFENESVAIKKIMGVFDRLTDAKRTLREIKLLKHFNHENILCLTDLLIPPVKENFTSVYLVTELLATDLRQIINSEQQLSEDHIRYFLYQIIRALKYLHSGKVIHRDLKPGNILLNENCDLKICDFGLARISDPEEENHLLTQYVATRWYRSPEIILSWGEYTSAVDVWSTGCIFAEILNRKPLFPGKDFMHQLKLITMVVGKPSKKEINSLENEKARKFMKKLPNRKQFDFHKLFPSASEDAIDLLSKMLQFNPQKRITVEESLEHPFFATIHDPDDEPICEETFDFSFEKDKLTKGKLRRLIYNEIIDFHKKKRQTYKEK